MGITQGRPDSAERPAAMAERNPASPELTAASSPEHTTASSPEHTTVGRPERTTASSPEHPTAVAPPAPSAEHRSTSPSARLTPSRGTRLDPWIGQYAERTAGMRASEIRALFSVASRPEVVSLAGGMPYLDALPFAKLGEMTSELLQQQGPVALQYGSGQGTPRLRELIVEVMAAEGTHGHVDDVVVTTGSQQALDLVTRIFVNPGDVILAESPSYVGALGVFRAYQGEVHHLPTDEFGLVPSALAQALTQLKAQGRAVKLLYTVPNFHNPGGTTLAHERRAEVVRIAEQFGVLILEDNPYGLLSFDGTLHQSLQSLNPAGVIYLGSFSKTFAPGYRVGWALAPPAIREKLVLAAESAILCPSNFTQMCITNYLSEADWLAQIQQYRDVYRQRRDAMMGALAEYLPQAKWTVPGGGFFTWVQLPPGLDSQAMLPRAVTELVAYVPGTAFYADGRGHEHMRLSFCYPTPERIVEGVRRLARVVDAELDMVEMFGASGAASGSVQDVQSSLGTAAPSPNQP